LTLPFTDFACCCDYAQILFTRSRAAPAREQFIRGQILLQIRNNSLTNCNRRIA